MHEYPRRRTISEIYSNHPTGTNIHATTKVTLITLIFIFIIDVNINWRSWTVCTWSCKCIALLPPDWMMIGSLDNCMNVKMYIIKLGCKYIFIHTYTPSSPNVTRILMAVRLLSRVWKSGAESWGFHLLLGCSSSLQNKRIFYTPCHVLSNYGSFCVFTVLLACSK